SELLDQCGHDLLAVVCLQSSRLFACIFHSHASTTSPVDLKYRTLRRLSPSPSHLKPTRSPLPVCGLYSITLETWSGISRGSMPPWIPSLGLGRTCFLTIFNPSTSTRSFGSTSSTAPRRPRSLPVLTMTSSPLRMRLELIAPPEQAK